MDIPPLDTILKLLWTTVPQTLRAPGIDPRRLGYFIAVWIGLEILAFSLVVYSLGFLATLFLALATTILGLSDLRRLFAPGRVSGFGDNRFGGLSAFGAFLLILPGFVSDLAGLALKSPSVQAALARQWNRVGQAADASGASPVIDLTPADYSNLEQPERPVRRRRAGSTR